MLNTADPDAPTVLERARAVAAAMSAAWDEVVQLDAAEARTHPRVGRTSWDCAHPVLDTTAALALGYEPAGTYAHTVAEEVGWLVAAATGGPEAALLPPRDDHAAEDVWLASRVSAGTTSSPGPAGRRRTGG